MEAGVEPPQLCLLRHVFLILLAALRREETHARPPLFPQCRRERDAQPSVSLVFRLGRELENGGRRLGCVILSEYFGGPGDILESQGGSQAGARVPCGRLLVVHEDCVGPLVKERAEMGLVYYQKRVAILARM